MLKAAGIVVIVGAALAASQALKAEERHGRYTMAPADDGFVRLDTETGALALCSRKTGLWACEPMPDGQQDKLREIDRLKKENQALKDEVQGLEESLGIGDPNKPGEASLTSGRPARSHCRAKRTLTKRSTSSNAYSKSSATG